MSQLTIYLPDQIEERARKAASEQGTSVSRWIADQVTQKLDTSWPRAILDAAGAFPDFPSLEEIRKGYGKDALRESLT